MVNNQSDERRHVVDQVFQPSFGHVDNLETCIKYDTVHCIGLIYLFFLPPKNFSDNHLLEFQKKFQHQSKVRDFKINESNSSQTQLSKIYCFIYNL